jgi:conjugal transfer pilus assembly protein TraB
VGSGRRAGDGGHVVDPCFAHAQTAGGDKKDDPKAIKISTDDMVNRSMADKEWMALSENQLTTQGNQIKTLQGDSTRLDQLQKQIEDLQGQNQALKTDGSKVLSAYQTENDQLRSQISTLSTQMQRATAGPSALYGAARRRPISDPQHPQWIAADAAFR